MANIEKRGKNYRIKVCIGYDSQGKKITKSTTYTPEYTTKTGKTKAESVIKKEVEEFAASYERKIKSGAYIAQDNMKLSDLIPKYLTEYAFQELSIRTAEGYKNFLEKTIIPKFGHYKICDLCQQQLYIQSFYNDMAKPDENGHILAVSTIKRRIAIFSSVLNWAVDMHIAENNPLKTIKPPKNKTKTVVPKNFSIVEINNFIKALTLPQTSDYSEHTRHPKNGRSYKVKKYQEKRYVSDQLKLFYILAIFTGCRRGELIALEWSDFDFMNCSVFISKSAVKTSSGIIIKSTKTQNGVRIIPLPESIIMLVKVWKQMQNEQKLEMGSAWIGGDNVFCQKNGALLYPDTVSAKFKKILHNYNRLCPPNERLPEISLHGLRHTAASIMINQGADIASVSHLLGHGRISTTLNIYTHAIEDAAKIASEKLNNVVNVPLKL